MHDEEYSGAFSRSPCGCLQLEKNKSLGYQPKSIEVLEGIAKDNQKQWLCPNAKHKANKKELGSKQLKTLESVENHTGLPVTVCETCPNYYASLPIAYTAVKARKWSERGLLDKYIPKTPAAVFSAVDVLDNAIAAQNNAECERMRAKAKPREQDK